MFHPLELEEDSFDTLDFLAFLFFFFLTVLIVLPWLNGGYILARDMIFTPVWRIPSFSSSNFLTGVVFHFFSLLIPVYILQKIILFAVIFFSMIGMYRLIKVKSITARIFASVLYVFNPFFYERLADGQWTLLAGYMLFPYILGSVSAFMRFPSAGRAAKLALFLALMANFSTHLLAVLSIFIIIYLLLSAIFNRIEPGTYWFLSIFLIIFLVLNFNWLIPLVRGVSGEGKTIVSISKNDLIAFQSVPDKNFGLIFNLLSGYGYWGETTTDFIIPKNKIFIWPIISLVFIILFIYGFFIKKGKSKDPLVVSLFIIFLLSLLLSAGVASGYLRAAIFELYDRIFFLKGFREPQKLVAVIFFSYAYFGAFALDDMLPLIRNKFKYLIILLPFLYTPTLFFGAWGQLRPVWYPQSWTEANKLISNDKGDFLTLFFPWHQYMRFKFANDRVVSNPALYYFDKPILSSQNYETAYLYSHDTRLEALHVDGLLSIEKEGVNLLGDEVEEKSSWGQSLSPINVKYIILAKEKDQKLYQFLDQSQDLEKISEDDNLILYKNSRWFLGNSQETETLEQYTPEDIKELEEN